MLEPGINIYYTIMLVGVLIGLALFAEALFRRVNLPALVSWIAIGFGVRFLSDHWGLFPRESLDILAFLAEIGIITLLFKVGLESRLHKLLGQIRRAVFVWFCNVLFSGVVGYVVSYYLLGLGLLPSIIIGIALTATSVGVSVKIWEDAGQIRSANGQLLLDIAELDDISGIILMGLLLALIPFFSSGAHVSFLPALGKVTISFLVRILVFLFLCIIFARYFEDPIISWVKRLEHKPSLMLTVTGIGFVIASLAALFGLSLALGAFFAGLAFSRNPERVKLEASFQTVYELFTPFFFIGIGLSVFSGSLPASLGIGAVLVLAAVLGKAVGTFLPVLFSSNWKASLILGFSMIPRAEIAMIIVQKASAFGEKIMPPHVYSSMVLVTVTTCMLAPFIVSWLFGKWRADAVYKK